MEETNTDQLRQFHVSLNLNEYLQIPNKIDERIDGSIHANYYNKRLLRWIISMGWVEKVVLFSDFGFSRC